jgi:hypothetical protein
MTDSAYVKNGIMQWMPNWLANHWKNSKEARVANGILWEQLLAAVKRMRHVKWSWVKAHDGQLLNECADTLATKGVMNEPRPCPVGFVRVVGEDEDLETYTLLDGEETPVVSENDGVYSAGKTFVMKAEDDGPQFLSESESADPTPDETTRTSIAQSPNSPVQSELEDSDTQPQPPESEDEERGIKPRYGPTRRRLELSRPDWWSPAWEQLNGLLMNGATPVRPVSPMQFKEEVDRDISVADQVGFQHSTDPSTGEEVGPDVDPNLMTVVTACVWNSQCATLI